MVKSEHGYVRSFTMDETDLEKIKLRFNEHYDTLFDFNQHDDQVISSFENRSKNERKNILKHYKQGKRGVMGKCLLRSLLIFDVGTSFMTDDLRNVNSDAFVSRTPKKHI